MAKKNILTKIGPIAVLFILSPIIAELLSGSTPASRAEQLIFESVFYGSAALLIREFVRRYKLGWFSIILLGFAFGIIEEGLLLQSAFNPHFLNYDIAFGRLWGVNWVWSEIIICNHAIWSITMPVLFAELIFPVRKAEAWLSKLGIVIFAILYLLSSSAFYTTFYKMSGFTTSLIHYAVAGFLAAGIILLAANLPDKPLAKYQIKTPPRFVIGIISFFASLLWLNLLSLVFKKDPGVPAWFVEFAGVVILSVLLGFILGWINSKWDNIHRFSLGCGTLYAGMVFGLIILIQSKNNLDIICQIVFILITSVLVILLGRRILNNESQQTIEKV
jgi:hypothetical protein